MANDIVKPFNLTGTIPWEQDPIYPGVTPICSQHLNEIESYTSAIEAELDIHEATVGNAAHPAVNLDKPGFITPDIINWIESIEERIKKLSKDALIRIPQGVIGMFDGSVKNIPDGWTVKSDMNGYYVIGASTSTTYPLHEAKAQDTSAIANLFTEANMPSHAHDFNNAYYAEHPKYVSTTESRFGQTVGSNDSDWDNSLLYVPDYTDYAGTDVTNTQFSAIEPKYISIPFVMKSYDNVNVKVTLPSNIYINGSNSVTSIKKGTIVNLTAVSGVSTIYANGYSRKVPCKYCISVDTKFSTSK